jgi:hypothetical protein
MDPEIKAREFKDPEIKALMHALIEEQINTHRAVGDLARIVGLQVDASEARSQRLEEAHRRTEEAHVQTEVAIASLAVSSARNIDAADARMKRIEENLDGLIRVITREHSNGKGRKQ